MTEFEKRVIEEKRAYFREWRRKNPDKVKASNQRYWEKRAAQSAASRRAEKSLLTQGGE